MAYTRGRDEGGDIGGRRERNKGRRASELAREEGMGRFGGDKKRRAKKTFSAQNEYFSGTYTHTRTYTHPYTNTLHTYTRTYTSGSRCVRCTVCAFVGNCCVCVHIPAGPRHSDSRRTHQARSAYRQRLQISVRSCLCALCVYVCEYVCMFVIYDAGSLIRAIVPVRKQSL